MRFLVDECLSFEIVDHLRRDGHDVTWISESMPSVSDKVVLQVANDERRILMSEDSDFGELVFRDQLLAVGVVSVRVNEFEFASDEMGAYVAQKFCELADHLIGNFTVIEPGRDRRRPLPNVQS